jgi:acyl carrier protein
VLNNTVEFGEKEIPVTDRGSLSEVKDVLVSVLAVEEREHVLGADTRLLGDMPELDSLALVELITALSERFGFDPDDIDLSGEAFETLGTLAATVDAHRA